MKEQVKAEDIRVGIWVQSPSIICDGELRTWEVTESDIPIMLDNQENYFGIPLSEEVLLKCPQFERNGIVKVMNCYNMKFGRNRMITVSDIGTPNGFIHISNIDEGVPTDIVTIYNWDYDKEIYLHQFQNIIHALTKTNLIYNH